MVTTLVATATHVRYVSHTEMLCGATAAYIADGDISAELLMLTLFLMRVLPMPLTLLRVLKSLVLLLLAVLLVIVLWLMLRRLLLLLIPR